MNILVACEYSGRVRDAFIKMGHNALSCDLLPSDSSGPHYQGNVFDITGFGWDLMVAHPPCTYLANSGVQHLYTEPDRWDQLRLASSFFRDLLNCPIPKIAIENPIMHKYAKNLIGCGQQSQVIQPWMHGHTEQKATCLWLKGLPLLLPSNDVKAEMMLLPKSQRQKMFHLPPSPDRWKLRSTTYQGFADAMADQWF